MRISTATLRFDRCLRKTMSAPIRVAPARKVIPNPNPNQVVLALKTDELFRDAENQPTEAYGLISTP